MHLSRRVLSSHATGVMSVCMMFAVAAFATPGPQMPFSVEQPLTEPPPCQGLARIQADKATLLLLEPDVMDLVDASGHIPQADIKVENGEIADDPVAGAVLRFGGNPGSVTISDKGRLAFLDGATVEAWVFLEEDVGDKPFGLAEKAAPKGDRATFGLSLHKGNRLTLDYVCLNGEVADYTDEEGVHVRKATPEGRLYPGRCNTMNGLSLFPAGKWTHVAFTYDRPRHLIRTWVDFGIDREAFNGWREVATELMDDDDVPLVLFKGATNLRVAQVHVASAAKKIGIAPPVLVHATELAYRGYGYIHVVQTSDDLPLPCEVLVGNLDPPSQNAVNRYVINDREPHNFLIPPHRYRNVTSELVVRFLHKGREIHRYETLICNPSAEGPANWRFLRGAPWTSGPLHPDWWLGDDNVIRYKEKPVFPLATGHVRTNGFELVASLGFTTFGLSKDVGKIQNWQWLKHIEPYFARAAELGVTLTVGECIEDRPAQGFLYAFDEPWGYSFAPKRQRYRNLRAARERPADLPVSGSQNNWQRYRETAACTDVFVIDPYCYGDTMMRFVYDATRAAVRETDGLKPIETIVANYGEAADRPDYDELRTMSYRAVVGGANMLAYYAWDEGDEPGGPQDTSLMPQAIDDYRRLLSELRSLEWALSVPNTEPGPAIEPARPRGFFACAKKARGNDPRTCLIIASDLYRTTTRTIVFPPAAGKKAVLLFGPGREGELTRELVFDGEGRAQVTIPPLSTLVFEYE